MTVLARDQEFATPEEFLAWFQDTIHATTGQRDTQTHLLSDLEDDGAVRAVAVSGLITFYGEYSDGAATLLTFDRQQLLWLAPKLIEALARVIESG